MACVSPDGNWFNPAFQKLMLEVWDEMEIIMVFVIFYINEQINVKLRYEKYNFYGVKFAYVRLLTCFIKKSQNYW